MKKTPTLEIESYKNDTVIYATNRKLLIDTIEGIVKGLRKHPNYKKGEFLHIKISSCGCERRYKTKKDIPKKSIKCRHGIQIIKYQNK